MTFIIPIGPQHPALEEPAHFRIEVKGEEIVGVDLRLGYNHKGIEQGLSDRSYAHGLYLSARICGICNSTHSLAFTRAVESAAGIECPDRARYIRVIDAELERIHSHLLWAGVAAHEIGFTTLFMLFWRDRELSLDMRELLFGQRIYASGTYLGGARVDINEKDIPQLIRTLNKLEKSVKHYIDVCTSDRTIIARCSGVGVLKKKDARELCAVGPTARASGVDFDIRRDDPYAAYGEIPFDVIVEQDGDVLAKVVVRLREILESIDIIRQAIDAMPKGAIRTKFPENVPENEAVGRTEAPRGELMYYVRSNGTNKPERVRIRTPSYANWPSAKPMLVGGTIAEIPIVVASIDPCYSCTDRVTIIDTETGKSRIVTKEELRRLRK